MIDSNISIEEDTELRDLVVQTLENNGVLAKVRAELRASVFLTLEEQESVLNPEPLLNKSVKQYLAKAEGKLLFSLVREFLEYFGLDYTISVFDLETYFGRDYTYKDRNKLSEELGIESKEPLLGEILKNTINSALSNSQKKPESHENSNLEKQNDVNATFDVSTPKIMQSDLNSLSQNETSSSEIEVNTSNSNSDIPFNVTITDKKVNANVEKHCVKNFNHDSDSLSDDQIELKSSHHNLSNTPIVTENLSVHINKLKNFNNEETVEKSDSLKSSKLQNNQNKNRETQVSEYQTAKNIKNINKSAGNTLYFGEIIKDGKKEHLKDTKSNEMFTSELPVLGVSNSTVSADLPPLNGRKVNLDDLKELMDLAEGVAQYDEDFTSSASGSATEQSPVKVHNSVENLIKHKEDLKQSVHSDNNLSEEIDEEVLSNTSCLDNSIEKNIANLNVGDYEEQP